jgi:hypothetical protein
MKALEGYFQTPESTYIFSQDLSNLQVSLVKKFNLKFNRSGTLMAGRFKRELITSKEKVIDLIQCLNNGKQRMQFSGIWADCAIKRIEEMTSRQRYESLEMNFKGDRDSFWKDIKNNLVGKFSNPSIIEQNFKFHYLERRLFKSACHYLE